MTPRAIVSVDDHVLAERGLPPLAYVDNVDGAIGDAPVLAVKRGEAGYYPIYTRRTADELNAALGVSHAQAQAMRCGSMFGWQAPGAFPAA